MSSPRVVELLGPPGSGKSSLAAAVGALPGVVVVKNHRIVELPLLVWSAAASGRSLLARPRGVPWLRWIAWLGRTRAAPRVVRRRLAAGSSAVVLDQGPAYTLGRVAATDNSSVVDRWTGARMAECRRLLDAVVLLDSDAALLADRLRSRAKRHRADELAPDAVVAYVERERATSLAIATRLNSLGVTLVSLDATRPLTENAAVVAELLHVHTSAFGRSDRA